MSFRELAEMAAGEPETAPATEITAPAPEAEVTAPEPAEDRPAPEDGPALESGTADNPFMITDPRAMRALAHPARIAILQHLVTVGPSTATECAETAGLSPSACSYHLRALARHGFVEEDAASAADGRHRPWRSRGVALSFSDDPDQPEPVRAAARLLSESVQARVEEVRYEYLDRQADYPPEWRAAACQHNDVLHVTPDEMAEVQMRLRAVLSDYRRLDAADRPAGSRRVHAIFDLTPWFRPDAQS
jgi:DNA-binding transcriptional ArsR family regulator